MVLQPTLAGIAGSNPEGGMDVCLLSCQAAVTVTGGSLVPEESYECSVSECHFEPSSTRRPWSTRAVKP